MCTIAEALATWKEQALGWDTGLCSFFLPTAALDYTQALQTLLIASVGVMFLRSRRR